MHPESTLLCMPHACSLTGSMYWNQKDNFENEPKTWLISISLHLLSPFRAMWQRVGGSSLFQWAFDKRQDSALITLLTRIDRQPPSHLQAIWSFHFTSPKCIWTVGGKWSAQREKAHTDTWRTCGLHTERLQLVVAGSGPGQLIITASVLCSCECEQTNMSHKAIPLIGPKCSIFFASWQV